jgi:octanoyl-[GcvH]:protein N-octanoyltransferase
MSSWRKELERQYRPWTVEDDTAAKTPTVPARGGTLEGDPATTSPEAAIQRDLGLAWKVARSPSPTSPLFRLWVNRPCLVTTRREARLPGFEAAARASEARGWPVFVRDSGGTTIPHLEGSLHLSLILPRQEGAEPGTDQVYTFLCEPVREALLSLGVEAHYGIVANSFCDGRFNLVAQGRKVAGTSQRWKGGIPGHPVGEGFILAHMTLFVEGDLVEATEEVNRFLVEAGGEGGFDPRAVVTVAELMATTANSTPGPSGPSTGSRAPGRGPVASHGDPAASAGGPAPGDVATSNTMPLVQQALRNVLGA